MRESCTYGSVWGARGNSHPYRDRRTFITLIGGAAAWPLAAHAQQPDRMRRIGVLSNLAADDPEAQKRNAAFLQALQQLGWTDGRNVRIDFRWGAADEDRNRRYASELVALAPDVILATGSPTLEPLRRATRSIPIIFLQVADPVGAGLVRSLAHPGGNITGFTNADYAMTAKWLELLKEIAPRVTRALVPRDVNATGIGQFAAIEAVAPLLGLDLRPADVSDADEVGRTIAEFAQGSNGDRGLIVPASGWIIVHRQKIVALAARHRLPAVYPVPFFVADGGLIAYGADTIDPYRRAAGYVDRILKGAKPADLPVQAPTKYELAINLKTAKTLGLDVPPTLLARADEVIE
jgi:putative ABC transport system substrate-binding protein